MQIVFGTYARSKALQDIYTFHSVLPIFISNIQKIISNPFFLLNAISSHLLQIHGTLARFTAPLPRCAATCRRCLRSLDCEVHGTLHAPPVPSFLRCWHRCTAKCTIHFTAPVSRGVMCRLRLRLSSMSLPEAHGTLHRSDQWRRDVPLVPSTVLSGFTSRARYTSPLEFT